MKLGLVGYFGYGNYGDELFLRVWRNLFGYENTQVIYPGDDLSHIDKIVIGGGDIILPSLMNNNYFRDEFLTKEVYVYGAGVPTAGKDNPEEIRKFQEFFSKVKYLSVRDEASHEWLKERGIKSVTVDDMVWSFNSPVKPKKEKIIGITIRQHPKFQMTECVKICLDLIERGHRLLLIPLQESYNQTRDLHIVLQERLTNSLCSVPCNITNYSIDMEHKWSIIQSLDAHITMAFHGAITALSAGVPTLMLATGNKFIQLSVKTGCPIAKDYIEYLSIRGEFLKARAIDERRIEAIKAKVLKELSNFKDLVLK
jgi:polysaccharide pyruvyl transferase WcaK-like protein